MAKGKNVVLMLGERCSFTTPLLLANRQRRIGLGSA
jgi:hypothetical protein